MRNKIGYSDLIKRNSLFQDLTVSELDRVEKSCLKRIYKQNQIIIEKERQPLSLLFIMNGTIESYLDIRIIPISESKSLKNRKVTVGFFTDMEIPNFESIIGGTNSIYNLIALTRVDVLEVPTNIIFNLMIENSAFRNRIYREFTKRTSEIVKRSIILPALTVEERVMVTIGRYATNKLGVISMGSFNIQKISELSFCSREMASRVFKQFQNDGLVTKDGRKLLISEKLFNACLEIDSLNKIQ